MVAHIIIYFTISFFLNHKINIEGREMINGKWKKKSEERLHLFICFLITQISELEQSYSTTGCSFIFSIKENSIHFLILRK